MKVDSSDTSRRAYGLEDQGICATGMRVRKRRDKAPVWDAWAFVAQETRAVKLHMLYFMLNSFLFLAWAAIALMVLLVVFRVFGKAGIMSFICVSIVIMNILVTKSVMIFGVGATGGNVLYASIFLSTDILTEYYSGRVARRAVMLGFVCAVFSLAAVWVTLVFVPAPWDWAQAPLSEIFTPVARIVAGSMIAYLISQNLDTYLYEYIRVHLHLFLYLYLYLW